MIRLRVTRDQPVWWDEGTVVAVHKETCHTALSSFVNH
jgi:hypothetical protein